MYSHTGLGALETLTRTVADSANGFLEAASHTRSLQLRELLERLAADRARLRDQLQSDLSRRGGPADAGGSTLGHLHQAWLNFRASIAGPDDDAVLEEVERGENYLKEKFETVMAHETLDEDIRTILERAYLCCCDQSELAAHFRSPPAVSRKETLHISVAPSAE